ncbi:MAG: TolC family protein [Bacteroidota bacterium]
MNRLKISLGIMMLFYLPSIAQVDSLSLQQIVLKAIENNKQLKLSALEIKKTEQLRKSIGHTYIPTLEASGMYAYSEGRLNLDTDAFQIAHGPITLPPLIPNLPPINLPAGNLNIPPIDNSSDYSGNFWMGGLTAKWTLFTGLKAPNLSKAVKHKQVSQEYLYQQEESDLIVEVAGYYDKVALLEMTSKVLDAHKERLEKEQKKAEKALENGLITQHDYQKIEIARLNLASKEIEYNGNKNLLLLKLQQLTGLTYEEVSNIKVDLEPRIASEQAASYLDRPELKALDEASIANDYKLKSEISGYLPKVQAFASHQYAGTTNGNIGSVGINEASLYPVNAVGVGVKWEIFDGLHTHNERQKIKIEIDQLELKKAETKELLELNYQNTISKYDTYTAQVVLKQKELKVAEKSLQTSAKEYENGLIQISDLLESQTYYTEIALEYYKIISSQREMSLQLLNTTGSLTPDKL